MFYVKEPSELDSAWILSHYNDEKVVSVVKDTVKDIKNYHVLGIDFLYQNYKKQFKGAILNEDEGMNMQLQVAAFLNAMFNHIEKKFLVLILAPDHKLINWHYHLTIHGKLKVQIITPNTCPEDFDEEHGLALLLSFSNIRLAQPLVDYDYFSVIIDNFDEVASKLVIRKLRGDFNIGLTQRNFYINPDQKMQWTMLNWSNPGCIGKLLDFYEIDNDNFANFRDNYHHWWFRLTWNFCESFKKLTDKEKMEYKKDLAKWAQSNHLSKIASATIVNKVKKRKQNEIVGDEDTGVCVEQKNKVAKLHDSPEAPLNEKIVRREANKVEESEEVLKGNSQNSEDTIIYEDADMDVNKEEEESEKIPKGNSQCSEDTIIHDDTDMDIKKERDPNYVQLPSMDENPILNSIIRNLEKSPEPVTSPYFPAVQFDLDQPNCSKAFEDADVLMSIINDTNPIPASVIDEETQLACKKEEIFSQIFKDEPCTSRSSLQMDDNNDFFQSLVGSCNNGVNEGGSVKRSRTGDIDDILKETEVLLKE